MHAASKKILFYACFTGLDWLAGADALYSSFI